jgi:hypothetical protein
MFQDFEKVSKDAGAGASAATGTAGGDAGMGAGDDTFMNLLNGFAKDLLKDDPAANNAAMDNILN